MKRRLAGDERQERRGKRPRQPARDAPHEVRRESGARARRSARPATKTGGEAASAKKPPRRRPRRAQAGAPATRKAAPGPRRRARAAPSRRSAPAPPSRRRSRRPRRPSGTELVTTAIQAAGELAQIGLAVGGQVLKRAVDQAPQALAAATFPRAESPGYQPGERGTQCGSVVRGGESAGLPAVALLSLREPVSSPRRQRRKP